MACRVVHAGQLTDFFMVKTGVMQGCRLSQFLFMHAIDWIIKTTTHIQEMGSSGYLRGSWRDFADDLALLSHSHQQMQDTKTELLHTASTQLALNINRHKTHIMKANTMNNNRITMNGEPLEETDSFTYIGSTIQKWRHRRRRQSKDTKSKARVAFIMLRNFVERNKSKLTQYREYLIQMSRQFYSMDRSHDEVHTIH